MPNTPKKTNAADTLLLMVDGCIASLVFLLPFLMGGREAWGHWFLFTSAFALGTTWCVYCVVTSQKYRPHWFELFFLAGAGLVWFQLQPLSADFLESFSGEYQRLIPEWASATEQPAESYWSTLSLTPVETQHGLWVFLAYATIFTVVTQRLKTLRDCHRLLRAIAVSGGAMTLFAFVQKATSNGQFFWFYKHPFTDTTVHLKGAFTNRNHFAQFAALSLPPLLWWMVRQLSALKPQATARPDSRRKHPSQTVQLGDIPTRQLITIGATGILIVVVAAAVLLSESRGGIIAGCATALIAGVGLFRRLESKASLAFFVLGGGILFFSMLAFAPQEELQAKIDQLLSGDADKVDAGGNRRAIWAADAEVIKRFPMFGTGVGSHRDVYPLYMEDFADHATSVMTHAESSFVNVALETGIVGTGILILGLLLLLFRLGFGYFRNTNSAHKSICVIVFACAIGGCLHGVVDFIWYAPAIVVVSLLLAAIGLRAASLSNADRAPFEIWCPRPAWATLGGFCVLALLTYQPTLFSRIGAEKELYAAFLLKPKVEYEDIDADLVELETGEVVAVEATRLTDQEKEAKEQRRLKLEHEAVGRFYNQRISLLLKSLKAQPEQHRVQLLLAQSLLLYFEYRQENSESRMPLLMVRDAAVGSDFESAEELQSWCRTAIQDNFRLVHLADRLSRESLRLCPIQGHGYLTIMRTDFINDPANQSHQALIDQALLVRGHDPEVQYVAGHEALFEAAKTQDFSTTLKHWSNVFHVNSIFRMKIIQQLASRTHASFFLQHFTPNVEELRDLLAVYDGIERETDATAILKQICAVVPEEAPLIADDDERLKAHLDAYAAARRLENLELAIGFLRSAMEQFPFEFTPRYQLGMTLVELERPDEALPHLEWCHDHDPGHDFVKKLIRRARQLKIRPAKQPPLQRPVSLTQSAAR